MERKNGILSICIESEVKNGILSICNFNKPQGRSIQFFIIILLVSLIKCVQFVIVVVEQCINDCIIVWPNPIDTTIVFKLTICLFLFLNGIQQFHLFKPYLSVHLRASFSFTLKWFYSSDHMTLISFGRRTWHKSDTPQKICGFHFYFGLKIVI